MDDSTLTASTGQNDPNSVWGSGLLTNIANLANQGAGVYKTLTTTSGSSNKSGGQGTAPTRSSLQKYLPWIAGGVVLLLIIGFVFRR